MIPIQIYPNHPHLSCHCRNTNLGHITERCFQGATSETTYNVYCVTLEFLVPLLQPIPIIHNLRCMTFEFFDPLLRPTPTTHNLHYMILEFCKTSLVCLIDAMYHEQKTKLDTY
jgi:hypothetical protein